MNRLRSLPLFVGSILLGSTALTAQQTLPRITEQVNDVSLTTLKGSVPAIARSQYDQGEADASTQMTGVRLVFSRTAEQQAALTQYLVELQEKSSPNYHKWLTPEQFGKLYGPADSDIAQIVAWLQSHGLTVAAIPPGRTDISFSGSVSQLEDAFHTSIHSFSANGHQFYSNTTEPSIPSALSGLVMGVAHLNTIKPLPLHTQGQPGKIDSDTKRLVPLSTAAGIVNPNLTFSSNGSYYLYIVPGDAATIYNTPNSTFNANFSSGTSYDGTGVKIGVGGDATIDSTIVQAYRSTFLGNSTAPTVINVNGVTSTADSDEAYIDTELAGAMAPAATIYFYTDSSDLGISQMIDDNYVDIFSLSFGACELDMSTADNASLSGAWQQAAGQGITVLVSSGDNGSAGCDNPNNVTVASGGLAVSGFASTPYNIAVGGTDFYSLESNFSTYATVPSSGSSSAGSSSTYYRTAKSYIPESTWNDSSYYDTTISANVPWTAVSGYTSYANMVAGSGGASRCSTNTTIDTSTTYTIGSCTSGYSKPTWQRGTGVPSDGARDIPDISLMAGDGMDGAMWAVCDNVTSSGITTNCKTGYVDGYGGTSTSSPAFAGILALIVQKNGGNVTGRQGQAAEELYNLYNGSHASSVFHDITVGNISVPCTSGTTNCTKNTAGYYFESGYDTTTGYDLATGLGSVDATALLTYWGTATGTTAATVAVTPSPSSIYSGQSLTETVSVTGSGSTPTGTITLTSGSYSATQTIGTSPCTSNTNCVFTIGGGKLAVGTDTLTATYSGDSTYASGTGTATVTVTQSTYAISLNPTSNSVTAGGSTTTTVSLSSSSSYTGTVSFACSVSPASGSSSTSPTCSFSPSSLAMTAGTPSGTSTLTISTTAVTANLERPVLPGRGWPGSGFAAGSGVVFAVLVFFGIPARRRSWRAMLTVLVASVALSAIVSCGGGGGGTTTSKLTPTVTVSPAKSSVAQNNSLSVPVTVTGSGTTPSGTITLSGGGYTSSSATLSSGSYTFTVPANSFTSTGSVTLTASYSGDSNYNSGSGTSTITVNKPATASGTYTITITGTGNDAAATTATNTFTLTVN